MADTTKTAPDLTALCKALIEAEEKETAAKDAASKAAEAAKNAAERAVKAAADEEKANARKEEEAANHTQAHKEKAVKETAEKAKVATDSAIKAKKEAEDKLAEKTKADAVLNDAAKSTAIAKAALVTEARRLQGVFGVGFFGVALGVLTSLTTAHGITATLMGLLFTFVGASLLSWFKRDTFGPEDRSAIAKYTGAVSGGLVIGLFIGFTARFVNEMWILPLLVEKANQPAMQFRNEVVKQIRDEINQLQGKLEKVNPNDKAPNDKWQEMKSSLIRIEGLVSKLGADTDKMLTVTTMYVPTPQGPFNIASAEQVVVVNLVKEAADAAAKELEWDEDLTNPMKGKLTQQDRDNLRSFEKTLRKDDPNVHPSPQVLDAIREMLNRKPKSPIPRKYATKLQTYLEARDTAR
jgi:hypothetical protein